MRKDIFVLGLNAVLIAGLCVLVGMGKITWEQLLAGLGLLFAPSALGGKNAPSA